MKKVAGIIFIMLCCSDWLWAQNPDQVLAEGRFLYRLERASWLGADEFAAKFPDQHDSIGGYFSYVNEEDLVVNVFFHRDDQLRIMVRFYYSGMPSGSPLRVDTLNHTATMIEMDLLDLRQDALQRIEENAYDFYTLYDNMTFNLIPVITGGERKVYVLTAGNAANVVYLGNDYLLSYDMKNKYVSQEKLHNSLLAFPYKKGGPGEEVNATVHSHVVSELITPTDICTLLLYRELTDWDLHYVVGNEYVSIFDIKRERLDVMPKKIWLEISRKQQKKKH